MAVIASPPKSGRTEWPPRDFQEKREVTLKDDWWSLAKQYGRKDAWDIIFFNFKTDVAAEVNWYLRENVGCTYSKDGKNYSFGRKQLDGRKLFIYIPKPGWKRGDDPAPPPEELATGLVIRVLLTYLVSRISFRLGGITIHRGDIRKVAHYIHRNSIHVKLDPTLGDWARYHPRGKDRNTIVIRKPEAGPAARALIVHEAVHAVMDIRGLRGMGTAKSEALAYLAQAIYRRSAGQKDPPFEGCRGPAEKMICGMSWYLAEKIEAGDTITPTEYAIFKAQIVSHPKYRADTSPGYNGV